MNIYTCSKCGSKVTQTKLSDKKCEQTLGTFRCPTYGKVSVKRESK